MSAEFEDQLVMLISEYSVSTCLAKLGGYSVPTHLNRKKKTEASVGGLGCAVTSHTIAIY